ncbi:MAG: hypothetical protein ACLGSD_02925 [Acidobacteriota bacterium]
MPVFLFSVLGFLVMGYHPGAEDDGVYLSAVNAAVHPYLYPHDAAFFKVQMHYSVFDTWMAHFVRATGMSIAWSELLWQFLSIAGILWACWRILCRLFPERPARWGGLAMVSAMLTLPVAGTGIYIADQYLHPRNPATALILLAVERVLARRKLQAIPCLLVAVLLHPIMGALGVSFCLVLALTQSERVAEWVSGLRAGSRRTVPAAVARGVVLIPLGWMFRPPTDAWLQAMQSRHWFWLYRWTWYEWLGALGPLVLFWLLARWARRRGEAGLARFSFAVLVYGVFQQAIALVVCGVPALLVFSTVEPMRYLQLVYVFLAAMGGALLGRHLLGNDLRRWVVFLIVANGVMFAAQRQLFAASPHLEMPGRSSSNPWLQAFAWIRTNTPRNAYFAVGPKYLDDPMEDVHSFRALAERSVLADAIKDGSVMSKAPELSGEWRSQVQAQQGWQHFKAADFERLKAGFGVDWVVLDRPPPPALACPWRDGAISVCRIP